MARSLVEAPTSGAPFGKKVIAGKEFLQPVNRNLAFVALFAIVLSHTARLRAAVRIEADPSDYRALLKTLKPGDMLSLAPGTYPRLPIIGLNGTASAWITITGPDSSLQVTVTGANFTTGATLAVSDPGVEVSNVTVASETEIIATFRIAPGAGLGIRGVTASTPSGTSNVTKFRINAGERKTEIPWLAK
jgi:hypothetical protein